MTHAIVALIVAAGVSLLGTQRPAPHRHLSHFVPHLYSAADAQGLKWEKEVLDDTLQPSWCTTADLAGDKQRDIVCIGRAEGGTLKWYENTASGN